jgi:hypothetical protein
MTGLVLFVSSVTYMLLLGTERAQPICSWEHVWDYASRGRERKIGQVGQWRQEVGRLV